ncbi:MAG: hypothetical protein M3464_14745 [Chloroflexota bacterium]|nr:hypothetical protein [Chloroflexota bacterium]
MHHAHLDHIARLIASSVARRRLLGGLLGGLLSPRLPHFQIATGLSCRHAGKYCGATANCCLHAVCTGRRCVCKSGFRSCNGVCKNLDADPGNCGACGYDCDPHQTCLSGVCLTLVGPEPPIVGDDSSSHGDVEVP